MPKYKVVVQRFPYGSVEHTPCVDWLLKFASEVSRDPRFDVFIAPPLDDTPITMTRNRAVEIARKAEADFLLMIDSDMAPDCELGSPLAKPFWDTTIDFMLKHQGPCVVGAPYCGPPPLENVYVFEWKNMESNRPDNDQGGIRLDQFTREQASILGGIQEVAALPTGLIVFDMRGFEKIPPPYFSYEYQNEGELCDGCGNHKPGKQTEKASTEDVVTTRDLSLGGVPQYCNWDAWAGHRKVKTVRKPMPFTVDGIARKMQEAIVARRVGGERLIEIKSERFAAEIAAAEAKGTVPANFKVHTPMDSNGSRLGLKITEGDVVHYDNAAAAFKRAGAIDGNDAAAAFYGQDHAPLFGPLPVPLKPGDLLG